MKTHTTMMPPTDANDPQRPIPGSEPLAVQALSFTEPKHITWQTRTATGSTEVDTYDTLPEAIGSMAGHDGCGGVWEADRAQRVRGVDVLVDDTGQIVGVAAYSSDDALLILIPASQGGMLHSYTEAEARKITARVATLDACGK